MRLTCTAGLLPILLVATYALETRFGGQNPQTIRHRIYVIADTGMLRRSEMVDLLPGNVSTPADWNKKAELTWDYYDHDAPITIELPACGQRQGQN